MDLPFRPFQRILKKAGAQRVSDEAVQTLRESAQHMAEDMAVEIVKVMRHADRRTVLDRDVKLVSED